MNSSGDLGRLETRQWEQLQDMASRFEAAWKDAQTVDLTAYLPPPGNPLRRVALHELIKTDLEVRWRRGQIIGVEAYLEKFPELGTVALLPAPLIYEEYRVRHQHGDKPALAGYERRFPRQFPELQRLVGEQPIPTAVGPALEPPPEMKSVAADLVLRIGGGYKLIKRIGCGGFAEVWQAETPGGFPVAIKRLLRPLDHAEAQLELRALGEIKRLSHPYLLQTRDYDLIDNRLYIVMDLADCTLCDRLQACKRDGLTGIPLEELLRHIRESAEALDYMHGERVHHRDIKPKNILLHKGHAKVADFGLARFVESQRMTVTGSGTAPYMAPEIWRRQVSSSSDLYSLAVSYAELRLGRLPFAGTDMYTLMMDHLEGRPNLDPLPEAEQEVLRQALSKDPAARFTSCLAFVEALERALEPLREQESPPSDSRRRRSTIRQRVHGTEALDKTMRPDDTPPQAPPSDELDEPIPPPPPWRSRPTLRGPYWALLAVTTGALLGLVGWKLYLSWFADFDVVTPDRFTVQVDKPFTLRVELHRHHVDGPIALEYSADGVTIQGVAQPGDEFADLNVAAEKSALLGERKDVVLRAVSGTRTHEVPLRLTVAPRYWQPNWTIAPGAKPLADAKGQWQYSAIDVEKDGIPVRFLLVPSDLNPKDLRTFYIMEDKVWNDLYARFAKSQPVEAGKTWKDGGIRLGHDDKPLNIRNHNGRHPALRMTCEEAIAFAYWLGGTLPRIEQWDKASGYYRRPRGRGPFREPVGSIATALSCVAFPTSLPWYGLKRLAAIYGDDPSSHEWSQVVHEIAIGRGSLGPWEVGKALNDISPFGCRDMAGNGCEWTATPYPAGEPLKKGMDPKERKLWLRGARYSSTEPWQFVFRDEAEKDPLNGPFRTPDPEYGFRVVIELGSVN